VAPLSPNVGCLALSQHFLVAVEERLAKSQFFSLIEESHLAAAINSRPVDAARRIFSQFTCLYRAPQYA
jgi:hypothetical protein